MTGSEQVAGRYYPTAKAYALDLACPDCGLFAWSCPCAAADNEATGMSDDGGEAA